MDTDRYPPLLTVCSWPHSWPGLRAPPSPPEACQGSLQFSPVSTYIQDSHWSSSYITALSLDESFRVLKYFHSVAMPALLCHKEPGRRIQSPLLGALERKIPLGGYFSCSSLALYGIRIGGFHAQKGSIIGALMP